MEQGIKNQESGIKTFFDYKSTILKVLILGSFICCLSCKENDMAKVKAMFTEQDADVEVADSVKFTYKEGEYIRAVVTGKTIKRYTKTQNKLEFPDGLLVKFYEQLEMISVLKADYAENNDGEQMIKVSGNVYMENSKFERLETPSLTWNIRAKRIYTDKAIKIRTVDNTIYGVGFDSDENFSNYTIRKVTGVVAVDDSKGFK
jgi:LPS export ABC transporter protein LptC